VKRGKEKRENLRTGFESRGHDVAVASEELVDVSPSPVLVS